MREPRYLEGKRPGAPKGQETKSPGGLRDLGEPRNLRIERPGWVGGGRKGRNLIGSRDLGALTYLKDLRDLETERDLGTKRNRRTKAFDRT